jgi:hypothetical protein
LPALPAFDARKAESFPKKPLSPGGPELKPQAAQDQYRLPRFRPPVSTFSIGHACSASRMAESSATDPLLTYTRHLRQPCDHSRLGVLRQVPNCAFWHIR